MPRASRARRPLLTTTVALTGAALALAAAMLSGPDRPDGPGPADRASPVLPGVGRAPTADDRLLHDAEQLLLRDCMRRQGFTYHVFPLDDDPGIDAFVYVLDDAAWARRHGYGAELRRRQVARARSDPNRAYFAALPADRRAAALVAANGPSPDGPTVRLPGGGTLRRSDRGCVAEAQRRLYGDLGAWFRASTRVEALERIRRGRVTDDPAYRERLDGWRQCMGRAGHAFATPAAARAAALSVTRPPARDREIALALAEVRCAGESGLARTARRLDDHHGTLLAREYRADVEARERLRAAALPRARQVVDAVPTSPRPEPPKSPEPPERV
ncbi:hypothetical protein ABZ135_31745 [Streptomyces sp. NPDC006339]|uniref:hypothetical protein n=1 Tax=Streptomyces sp. NPDC006339 TaxID=3156755 RepID=UPI0033B6517C